MSETQSPSGRFNLLNRAKKDNLIITPKYKRLITETRSARTIPSKPRTTPKTPITSGRFSLRHRASLGGLKQKWDIDPVTTQFQKEQKVIKRGGGTVREDNISFGDAEELLDRPIMEGGAKPKNQDNKEAIATSPIKKPKKNYKTNADTRAYDSATSTVPTSAKIGTRTIDLKNYNLLDKEDWSRIGKGSRIAYEKKDGKVVEGHVLHALYANKKDEHDDKEYMLLEAYNFKPGKKGTFKWPLSYDDIKHLWVHPGQSKIVDKEYDLRRKFNDAIDTKRTTRNPRVEPSSTPSVNGVDKETFGKLKNNVDNNITNLNDLLQRHEELKRKNEKLESDIDNIMSFLTRKYQNQFQPAGYHYLHGIPNNNMQSQVL